MKGRKMFIRHIKRLCRVIGHYISYPVYFGRSIGHVPDKSIVLFPYYADRLFCGLSGIIYTTNKKPIKGSIDMDLLFDMAVKLEENDFTKCLNNQLNLDTGYLGGDQHIKKLFQAVCSIKNNGIFYTLYTNKEIRDRLTDLAKKLDTVITGETKLLTEHTGRLDIDTADILFQRIENLKDIAWCLTKELVDNVKKIKDMASFTDAEPSHSYVNIFKKINAVLNSLDRLEVRGRDSAGISLMFTLDQPTYMSFEKALETNALLNELTDRSEYDVLLNKSIAHNRIKDITGKECVALTITYKVAAEIGCLGDNIRFIRDQIKKDRILQLLATFPSLYNTVSSHTRWASVGAITEANCHPVDNHVTGKNPDGKWIIHACLNGDIDNYLDLKKEFETNGTDIHEDITTDTKIIPLWIDKYLKQDHPIEEAFRLAVNDFKGSHAISMHTDLAPGKLFLAQRGSGQALFIGISEDLYMPTSEVYGFVEETSSFIKATGEKTTNGHKGDAHGQIYILNQETPGGIEGIMAFRYDNTPILLDEKDIKYTDITSRDIDRQAFPHYFLKEISESPNSVEKTLRNRWKIKDSDQSRLIVTLEEKAFPKSLQLALTEKKIRRIFFIGQGTAGIAAKVCANILNYYMADQSVVTRSLKASELSGFIISAEDNSTSMADALIIAISQSGTTTDTNRTIDMVKERGAHTLAIVNRRDSDITFKVDGVFYTSSGRDIEMSVASTKAFYSQIIAGALLNLNIAQLKGWRNEEFVTDEIKQLLTIPSHMQTIIEMSNSIENSAKKFATTKTYWAAVGSGPNKASADEIRIKLSELCYKTISSDFVEDKKHIDLSSEPLIIICAAGTREAVIGDIIKDTAIFRAHKATPIVIADQNEKRFDPYAATVLNVPVVSEHLAPIINTLAGHIWGYHAALVINEGSRFLYNFREDLRKSIENYNNDGLDIYEIILEKSFREKIALFYNDFRAKKSGKSFPIKITYASDLILLLKYLSGKLPVSDFEIDFGKKGTARNMITSLFECMGESINAMSRPVDAIKHQAKTVTVGTSRISEKVEGLLFEALVANNINISQLLNRNILVLKHLQKIVSGIKGAILYKIDGLNLLGEPSDETSISMIKKEGVLKEFPSRVEADTRLKGTKKIIVRQGNVYIGKGRKDDRSIIIIPILSASPGTPNMLEYLLLLNISFRENVLLEDKITALGGKYEHIKNIVQENSLAWNDKDLELVAMEFLFGRSAEKIGEYIASRLK